MNKMLKSFLTLTLGWVFIFLGILGLFLPVLQGFLFLFIGLSILSLESPTARNFLSFIKRKFPKVNKKLEKASHKAKNILGRLSFKKYYK